MPGNYEAEIVEVVPEQASTGTDFLRVVFKILGPTHEGQEIDCPLYLTKKAVWKLDAFLRAARVERHGEKIETAELLGRRMQIHVRPNGHGRPEVIRFDKIGGKQSRPDITDDDIPF